MKRLVMPSFGIPLMLVIVFAVGLCVPRYWMDASGSLKAQRRISAQMIWQQCSSNGGLSVLRAKVPGGWFVLVRDREGLDPIQSVGGSFFFPDPAYTWDGTSLRR